MKLWVIAVFATFMVLGPARADNARTFVADWLDQCYAAADVAYAEIPLPQDRGHNDAQFKASYVEFGCSVGPRAICRHSADPAGCLTAARVWMEQERDRIVAQLPRTLAEGQSPARRFAIRRYEGFIESNGQRIVPGTGVEDCIGTGATSPELGFMRQECELQQVSTQLGEARDFDRRIVAGILR